MDKSVAFFAVWKPTKEDHDIKFILHVVEFFQFLFFAL